jgi:hypothetical protein
MPIFRRSAGDTPDPADPGDPTGLTRLSDRELLRRVRALDLDVDSDGDPAARAAAADALAAEALRRRPDDSSFWYDRGMYAKWRRDWAASVEYNRRALDLLPAGKRREEAAAWNLGIAATAVRDWATARDAWTAYGLDLPALPGQPQPPDPGTPIEGDFGPAPVRLNADPRFVGHEPLVLDGRTWRAEVVWGRRLCPARVRILNGPTPESGHRFGDVVLHDGDTVGTRRFGDAELGVFNEIELWERSSTPTLAAAVQAPDAAAVRQLSERCDAAGLAAEDWTGNVQLLCRECSEGSPDHEHRHHDGEGWSTERTVGLAAGLDPARTVLDEWAATGAGRSWSDLDVVLR